MVDHDLKTLTRILKHSMGPLVAVLFLASIAFGATIPVAVGGSIQTAINTALAGDVVEVASGTFVGDLVTIRSGTAANPITVRAATPRGVIVSSPTSGNPLQVLHSNVVFEGLVLQGNYGPGDCVRMGGNPSFITFRNVEVHQCARDCIDLRVSTDVLIEDSFIHHCIQKNTAGTLVDAHGVTCDGVNRLTIRRTRIFMTSGDSIQLCPSRLQWDDVLVEDSSLEQALLDVTSNGFPPGTAMGENAFDSKVDKALQAAGTPKITFRNIIASGWNTGAIGNMAAFNVKESVFATFDRITVRSSEIAFRLRGPDAQISVKSAEIYDCNTAFRLEDGLSGTKILFATIFNTPTQVATAGSAPTNLAVLNVAVPSPVDPDWASLASGATKVVGVAPTAYQNAAGRNFQLPGGSPLVGTGITDPRIGSVLQDFSERRLGNCRNTPLDVGAFQLSPVPCSGATTVAAPTTTAPITATPTTTASIGTTAPGGTTTAPATTVPATTGPGGSTAAPTTTMATSPMVPCVLVPFVAAAGRRKFTLTLVLNFPEFDCPTFIQRLENFLSLGVGQISVISHLAGSVILETVVPQSAEAQLISALRDSGEIAGVRVTAAVDQDGNAVSVGSPPANGTLVWIIIVAVVGGCLLIAAIVVAAFLIARRRKHSPRTSLRDGPEYVPL